MVVEIIDLTDSPPSPPRSSNTARILNFGAASVQENQSGKASQIVTGFQPGMHGETVPQTNAHLFPHGTRLKDPWTQAEHELFLLGLNKCGKGRWSRIAKDFLRNKTPQQVQRYAASYFRNLPSTCLQDLKTKKPTYSGVNNLMGLSSSFSMSKMVNEPQQTLMLFPEKAPSFHGYQPQQTGGASTSMTATVNGEVDLELRLGRCQ
ncbi:hypothetical protein VNO77_02327 [Canavalia gladiata]|uniref:MYB transcription factor n=1 Tax=Canavalia gladiata TaxID=3824 RepID=A0AAN9MUV3_CANGL